MLKHWLSSVITEVKFVHILSHTSLTLPCFFSFIEQKNSNEMLSTFELNLIKARASGWMKLFQKDMFKVCQKTLARITYVLENRKHYGSNFFFVMIFLFQCHDKTYINPFQVRLFYRLEGQGVGGGGGL